jgi:flagellar motor protein MotB
MEATPLRLIGVISTAVLSLTLGAAAPAYAQQEQHDQQEEQKAKPAQQEEKKTQPAKPAKQAEKPAQQRDKNAKQGERNAQQQDKNTMQEEKNAQQQQQHTQQAKPGQPAQHAGGGRIPDDRFKANFGREHRFRVSQADYSRDRRFQYGGYWFGFVDPWPSNWLYTQDVFVVEINGVYYLCNPMYPGVNITLSFAP